MERELSYDLHIHSCLSSCGDDDMTPGNIVGMAAIKGLDVIAVTDHNSCRNCPAVLKLAEQYGVLAPLIARPRPEGGYEIISGHRRQHAAQLAGLDTLPVIVRNMDDDDAVLLMVDAGVESSRQNARPGALRGHLLC